MNSIEFIRDFTDWIKQHTAIEALYVDEQNIDLVFYAKTSEKNTFLLNSMIFTEYDSTNYCKFYNDDINPHLDIEFFSGNKAVIKLISSELEPDPYIKELFSR